MIGGLSKKVSYLKSLDEWRLITIIFTPIETKIAERQISQEKSLKKTQSTIQTPLLNFMKRIYQLVLRKLPIIHVYNF